MKIGVFSDTHSHHRMIDMESVKQYDMLIFAGDCSNPRDKYINANEVLNFIEWYESLEVPHKLWIAGNHETSIYFNAVRPKEICKSTTYLYHELVVVAGLRIFGSPYTPTFGDWAFMKSNEKLHRLWEDIPEGLDILVTHGPPHGVLDLSKSREGIIEMCGDKPLLKRVQKVKPLYHIFGHIHNSNGIHNEATLIRDLTMFKNVSCVTDGNISSGLTSFIKTIIR